MADGLKLDLESLQEEIDRPAVSDWLKPILHSTWIILRALYSRTRKLEQRVKALEDDPNVRRALHRGDPHDYIGEP